MIKINNSLIGVTGPFKHYNSLAAYLVCVITLFIQTFFISCDFNKRDYLKNKIRYREKFFLLFLLLGCLFLTFSRGGWAGFLAASLLMLSLTSKWKPILLFTIFLLIFFLVPSIKERIMGGDSGRFDLWIGAYAMIKEHPWVGIGIGNFMSKFSQYTEGLGIQYAHNCYLQIWAETGIFALLSFIIFNFLILSEGVKSFRKSHDCFVLGLLCAIFGLLVHGFFDNHFYSLQLSVLFWSLLGLIMARLRQLA